MRRFLAIALFAAASLTMIGCNYTDSDAPAAQGNPWPTCPPYCK